tara:strand:- start:1741 stop:2526 length:786 start_codon:yes stop_codon:yes gene_type:complete
MHTYKEYYQKCRNKYDGSYSNLKSLDELTIEIGNLHNEQLDDVKSIHNFALDKINKKIDLFDVNHENIIKVDNISDCNNISRLGNYFGDYLEKNYYGCHTIIEAVLIYQSLPNKVERSSWVWHYDDNVNEQIKVMVYLNNVTGKSGAMDVLMDSSGNGCKIKTSKIAYKKSTEKVYVGSRIPDIDNFKKKGYLPKRITGESGTYCIFDPNCIHKATTPTEEPYRLCVVYNFRPYLTGVNNRMSKSFTKTWSNLGNIKEYSI